MNKNSFSYLNSNYNFQNGNNAKPYADENEIISDAPKEVQKMLIDIYKISQKYDSHDQIDRDEPFGKALVNIDQSLDNMLSNSLINLTREIDYGQEEITNCRFRLEEAQNCLFDINANHLKSKRSMFFKKYYNSLIEKSNFICDSIKTLELRLNSKDLLPSSTSHLSNENNVNHFLSTCNEQNKAIIRCSSRIYRLNEKTKQIRERLYKLSTLNFKSNLYDNSSNSNTDNLLSSSDGSSNSSLTTKLFHDYKVHMEERKRDLEKRNTDRSLFRKKDPNQNLGFTFGTGNSTSFGAPKANYGINNVYSIGFSGNTNKTITSNPTNSVLSTPTKANYGGASQNDITPTKVSVATGGMTGFASNQLTPMAPRKGSGVFLDDP